VTDTGHHAEAQHHLLIDIQHRDQQQQCPQQGCPIVLPGLCIGAECTCIIVADHDNETRPENGEQRAKACPPAPTGINVALPNCAECAADVSDIGLIEDRAVARFHARRGSRAQYEVCRVHFSAS